MRLLHYSAKPIEHFDRARTYDWPHNYKPPGFWVSVEGEHDWYEWCQSENFGPDDPLVYEVTLTDSARILRVTSLDQIDSFHREWVAPENWPRSPEVRWKEVMREMGRHRHCPLSMGATVGEWLHVVLRLGLRERRDLESRRNR